MKTKIENRFAFLIHPPELKDVAKKYPFAKFIPNSLLEKILKLLPPLIGSQITGFKLAGKELKGWVVICPLTAKQMLDYPELAQRKVLQTVRLAERLGCRLIGLGAFSSIATDGGLYLLDKVKKIGLTTGNAYAAALIIENLFKAAKKAEVDLEKSTLALIGAAGSVGSACAKILSSKAKKIILIDKRIEELRNLVEAIKQENPKTIIEYYAELPQCPLDAGFIVTAASATEGILKPMHVIPGTIIIDAAQPSNVSVEVVETRKDVIVIHSGIAHLQGINVGMNIGLGREEIYACLGEVLILLWKSWQGHYSIDKVNPAHVKELLELAPKVGLSVVGFRNSKGLIEEEDFQRIKIFINR